MPALTAHLFPDVREEENSIWALNELLRQLPREGTIGLGTGFTRCSWASPYPVVYELRTIGVNVDDVLMCVARAGWRYPALVVYREGGDHVWSQALLPRLGRVVEPE